MNVLALITLLCGGIFSIAGTLFYKFPPKKINYLAGYRTPRAMKNQNTWNIAQKYAARLMVIEGFVLLIIGIGSFFLEVGERWGVIFGLLLLVAFVFLLFFETEMHLRKTFDKDGNYRN